MFTCKNVRVKVFINVVLVLFLLTEQLRNTFEVGIEFELDYKPQYEDLEHPTTKTLVKRIEDGVSNNSRLSKNL